MVKVPFDLPKFIFSNKCNKEHQHSTKEQHIKVRFSDFHIPLLKLTQ